MSENSISIQAIQTLAITRTESTDNPQSTINFTASLIPNHFGDEALDASIILSDTASLLDAPSLTIPIDLIPAILGALNHLYQQHMTAVTADETESDVLAQIGPSGVITNED